MLPHLLVIMNAFISCGKFCLCSSRLQYSSPVWVYFFLCVVEQWTKGYFFQILFLKNWMTNYARAEFLHSLLFILITHMTMLETMYIYKFSLSFHYWLYIIMELLWWLPIIRLGRYPNLPFIFIWNNFPNIISF